MSTHSNEIDQTAADGAAQLLREHADRMAALERLPSIRKLARSKGLRVVASRAKAWWNPTVGTYGVVDADGDFVMYRERPYDEDHFWGYGLTLAEVEQGLQAYDPS